LLQGAEGLTFGLSGGQLMRGLRVGGFAALAVLLSAWGCGSSTPTESTPVTYTRLTETYTGSIGPGETKAFHFAITNPGSLDAAITSLSPVSTLTMGLNLGAWDATTETCSKAIPSDVARLNLVLSGTPQSAGEYCVSIYDVGNLQSAADFTLTVQHY
jgi:hypothetical protein